MLLLEGGAHSPSSFQTSAKDTIQRRKWRGKKAEQELCDMLRMYGWSARRSAGSGVGGFVSDVESCNATTYLAIEVKSSRRHYAEIPGHQLAKIKSDLEFIKPLVQNSMGLIAVKFPKASPPWTFQSRRG
jgi:Holliday junction resolvase